MAGPLIGRKRGTASFGRDQQSISDLEVFQANARQAWKTALAAGAQGITAPRPGS